MWLLNLIGPEDTARYRDYNFEGVVFAETGRKAIPEEIKKYVTQLFLEWNPTIEIDWDSYYLTWEFRKIELRMKPVPVENPKYCLA